MPVQFAPPLLCLIDSDKLHVHTEANSNTEVIKIPSKEGKKLVWIIKEGNIAAVNWEFELLVS